MVKEEKKNRVKVTASILNVRNTPKADGIVVGTVYKGESYKILEKSNNFIKIDDGKWISADFVEEI